MAFAGINPLAILIAAVAGFAFGAVYYMAPVKAMARGGRNDQGGDGRQAIARALHRFDRWRS